MIGSLTKIGQASLQISTGNNKFRFVMENDLHNGYTVDATVLDRQIYDAAIINIPEVIIFFVFLIFQVMTAQVISVGTPHKRKSKYFHDIDTYYWNICYNTINLRRRCGGR